MINEIFHVQADEKVILKFRKHWFILLLDSLGTIITGILPFALFPILAAYNLLPPALLSPSIATFAAATWLLIIWCTLTIIWTLYYLDVWIVTNHRIVNIDQRSLFDRNTTTWRLDRVQQVTVAVQNIFETLLGFGTIEVETSGPSDEFAIIHGVRDPDVIQQKITEEVDRFMDLHYRGRVSDTPLTEDSL